MIKNNNNTDDKEKQRTVTEKPDTQHDEKTDGDLSVGGSDLSQRVNRIRIINDALALSVNQFVVVRDLSVGGLVNNSLRCKVWPKLLAIDKSEQEVDHVGLIRKHRDSDQVDRDIERSLFKLIGGNNTLLQEKRKELSNIIKAILSTNPELHYFQGYHDIASVLLMVCGERIAYVLLKKLSLYHIRDYLNSNLDVVMHLLQQIFPLLRILDKEVHDCILAANLEPYFALSWVLTWFSHSIDDLPVISRLFDFFLASHPYAVVYMSVAVVIYRREELLKCPREYSAMHTFLSKLPPDIPFEVIIERTKVYLEKYPPSSNKVDFTPKNSSMPNYPFNWMQIDEGNKKQNNGMSRTRIVMYASVAVLVVSVVYIYYNKIN